MKLESVKNRPVFFKCPNLDVTRREPVHLELYGTPPKYWLLSPLTVRSVIPSEKHINNDRFIKVHSPNTIVVTTSYPL